MRSRFGTEMACAVVVAMITSAVSADDEIGYTESFSPNGDFTADWCVEGATINFRITADASGWVGLGFSDNQLMPNSDIIQANGAGAIQDGWALARAAPPADASQDVTLRSATEDGGTTIVEFSRLLDTGDEDDLSLDRARYLLWAFNASNDSFNQRHSFRGFSPSMLVLSAASPCATPGIDPDFNDDGSTDTTDIDDLVMEIIGGSNNASFDINGDTFVNQDDLTQWRNEGALANGFGQPYLLGDANLDGTTDSEDLSALGVNWLTSPNRWSEGDFTADGFVDVLDFNALGVNWLKSIPRATEPVPESSSLLLLVIGCLVAARRTALMGRPAAVDGN